MPHNPVIVFVCEHGAAKSIIAAAHFNKLSSENGLQVQADARGTDPDSELSAKAITGLRADGLTPMESAPQKLSLADIEAAQRIVSFCALPEEYEQKAVVEHWDGIPPVSEDYEKARDAIVGKINELIRNIA